MPYLFGGWLGFDPGFIFTSTPIDKLDNLDRLGFPALFLVCRVCLVCRQGYE